MRDVCIWTNGNSFNGRCIHVHDSYIAIVCCYRFGWILFRNGFTLWRRSESMHLHTTFTLINIRSMNTLMANVALHSTIFLLLLHLVFHFVGFLKAGSNKKRLIIICIWMHAQHTLTWCGEFRREKRHREKRKNIERNNHICIEMWQCPETRITVCTHVWVLARACVWARTRFLDRWLL